MDGAQTRLEQDGPLRSGHKGSDMTAPMQRIEVITRRERRRRWSVEEKREIVSASLRPGVRPSEIIEQYGITSGQLYAWRQQLTRRIGGELAPSAPRFAQVAADFTALADALAQVPLGDLGPFQAAAE